MIKRFIIILIVLILCCPAEATAARKNRKRIKLSKPVATSALLMDSTSHKVYYEKKSRVKVYPASTAKVMTALLVLERMPLDKRVTVKTSSTKVQETKLNLIPGEQYTVKDLLFAILLKSANDAANVLAEAVGGTQDNFVKMMNDRARQLGATHTLFSNAHGLPSNTEQFTTAHDMALVLQEALKNSTFRNIMTFRNRIIYSKEGRRHYLKSHNRSLFLNWRRDVYGKTGYTRQAQSCFIGYVKKDKRTLIIAVFDSHKRWEDVKLIIEKYGKVDL